MSVRTDTLMTLARMGITNEDAAALVRAERTLHTWHEHECNGTIQRDEATGVPYWHYGRGTSGPFLTRRAPDREKGATARAGSIAGKYGLTVYVQGDPRGCALYLLRPGDVPEGKDAGAYYNRGIAVCG